MKYIFIILLLNIVIPSVILQKSADEEYEFEDEEEHEGEEVQENYDTTTTIDNKDKVLSDAYAKYNESLEDDSYKYTVSIRTRKHCHYFGDNHLCCGVLIKRNIVLSVANCFVWKCRNKHPRYRHFVQASTLSILAGARNRLKSEPHVNQESFVKRLVLHPHYSQFKNNLAILVLERFIEFTDFVQKPMFLDGNLRENKNYTCKVTAVGRMYYGGPLTTHMRTHIISTYTDFECAKYYEEVYRTTESHALCTEYVGYCRGDTGAPLMCGGNFKYLCGLLVPEFECNANFPSVFLRLGGENFRWIKKYITDPEYREDHSSSNKLNLFLPLNFIIIIHIFYW